MSVINPTALMMGDEGYQISRSVRLRSSASAYFSKTPAAAGNLSTWTWSAWVKRGTLSSGYQVLYMGGNTATDSTLAIIFTPTDLLQIQGYATAYFVSSQVFRDPSAWYHIVVALDSTQATQANRCKVYVNGVQINATTNAFPLNGTWNLNNNLIQAIGYQSYAWGFTYFDGYMTEMNFVNSQQLTAASFGEFDGATGVWKPKKYAGTYGTNGFYLNFSDNSAATAAAIGKDSSGNGNNWTPNNISLTAGVTYDSMIDTPTPYADGGNGRGNYCVFNPIDSSAGSFTTQSVDGNLKITTNAANSTTVVATMAVSSGKWYWEMKPTTVVAATQIGIFNANASVSTSTYLGQDANGWAYSSNATKLNNASSVSYGATFTSNDVIGVALDLDSGTIEFYKNGTSQGVAYTGLAGTFKPAVGEGAATAAVIEANFGQRPFTYTPPTGFNALNTQNLPDSTIKKGNKYFDATTYTGTGATLTVTNTASMQPDLVWLKGRSGATDNALYDSVRGVQLDLVSNSTAAETTQSTGLTAFASNGFTVGALAKVNTSSATYVGWQWKKGATQGFDIVTFSGTSAAQNVNHSLGVAPAMVITKARNTTNNWWTYHASLGGTKVSYLNLTNASAVDSSVWNSTAPTSSVFTVGSAFTSGTTYVAYLFAEVAGFSKFGSYTGNGSADGPFVYCGFRPKFVMIKRTDVADDWEMRDVSRDTYNVQTSRLRANQSAAEITTAGDFDYLSNGFKPRNNNSAYNASGGTYIFAAFAENPFKNSLAR